MNDTLQRTRIRAWNAEGLTLELIGLGQVSDHWSGGWQFTRATVVPESVKERRVANLGGDRLGRGFDDLEAILAYSEIAKSMGPSRQSRELHTASFRS